MPAVARAPRPARRRVRASYFVVRRAALCCLLLTDACRPTGPYAAPGTRALAPLARTAAGEEEGGQRRWTLGNGLTVVLEKSHATSVVALQAWIGGPAEGDDTAGARAAMLDRLQGVDERSPGVRRVLALGGATDVWSDPDASLLEVVVAGAFQEEGLAALSRMLREPNLDPEAIEDARAAVVEWRRRSVADPRQRVVALSMRGARDVPARPGERVAVEPVGHDDLAAEHRRRYVGANVVVVMVGALAEESRLRPLLEATLGTLPRGHRHEARPSSVGVGPRALAYGDPVGDRHLLLEFSLPPAREVDRPALDVLAAALGQGAASRLRREVVLTRQAAVQASARLVAGRTRGVFIIDSIVPADGSPDASLRALLAEWQHVRAADLETEDFERGRTLVEAARARARSTPAGRARQLGFCEIVVGDSGCDRRYDARLRTLAPSDVRAAAARALSPEALAFWYPTPAGGREEAVAARLAAAVRDPAWSASSQDASDATASILRQVLPGGPTVILARDPGAALVSIRATWDGGVRVEDQRTAGAARLIAALLPRGTRSRTGDALDRALAGLGATLYGVAGRSSLGLQADVPARRLPAALEIVGDALLHPSFAEGELEIERRLLLDQSRARAEDPRRAVVQQFHEALWPGHPNRQDPLGLPHSVATLDRRRLLAHFRTHYPPERLVIAVVGDLDPVRTLAQLGAIFRDGSASFGADERRAPPPGRPAPPVVAGPVRVARPAQVASAHAVLGFPAVPRGHPDQPALAVLARILGAPAGRLPSALVRQRHLAESVEVIDIDATDAGYIAVRLETRPEDLDATCERVRAILREIASDPPAPEEIESARRYLIGAEALRLQDGAARAAELASNEARGLGHDFHAGHAARIMAVTAGDVARVARATFQAEREVLSIIVPERQLSPTAFAVPTP